MGIYGYSLRLRIWHLHLEAAFTWFVTKSETMQFKDIRSYRDLYRHYHLSHDFLAASMCIGTSANMWHLSGVDLRTLQMGCCCSPRLSFAYREWSICWPESLVPTQTDACAKSTGMLCASTKSCCRMICILQVLPSHAVSWGMAPFPVGCSLL